MDETAAVAGSTTATVLLGAGLGAAGWAWRAARPLRTVATGVVRAAAGAAAVAAPATTDALARRGRAGRAELEARVEALLGYAVGRVVDAFLASTDLTALVLRHVDLDVVAARLDVDKVVARVDLDAIVRRIDLDGVAAGLDVDAVVARVDLDAIVRRIDLDGVAARLDVEAVVARVDPETVVRRVDLVAIAREVVDGIDLPEIIRHSSGALTSDTVRTVRVEARQADDVVAGFVDRLLHRRAAATGSATAPAAP